MEMKLELARLSTAKERARAEAQQAQSQVKSPSSKWGRYFPGQESSYYIQEHGLDEHKCRGHASGHRPKRGRIRNEPRP